MTHEQTCLVISQLAAYHISIGNINRLTPLVKDYIVGKHGNNPTAFDIISRTNDIGKAVATGLHQFISSQFVVTDSQKLGLHNGTPEVRVKTMIKILDDNYGGLEQTLLSRYPLNYD